MPDTSGDHNMGVLEGEIGPSRARGVRETFGLPLHLGVVGTKINNAEYALLSRAAPESIHV